jgi:hypothetical protein
MLNGVRLNSIVPNKLTCCQATGETPLTDTARVAQEAETGRARPTLRALALPRPATEPWSQARFDTDSPSCLRNGLDVEWQQRVLA